MQIFKGGEIVLKRFNFEELLWLIVIILIDFGLIYLLVTGKVELYVGKKMIKYIYISVFMLGIIGIVQISNVFTPIGNNNIKIKLVPIILALIIGFISINTQTTFKHIELNKELTESSGEIYSHDHNDSKLNIDKSSYKIPVKEPIIVDEENPMILEDIKLNAEKYVGKQIEVYGFVCKESYLNKNQFIIGRIIMNCCAADSKVVGIIGEWEQADDLRENQWVQVKGTINYSTINDDDGVNHQVPIIKIDKLEIGKKK